MPTVPKVRLSREDTISNMKNILTHAMKRERGYMKDLVSIDKTGGTQVEKFANCGFIKTGYTTDSKTYAITDLGREYFSDFFASVK